MLFTFEINRHGARAPFWDDPRALDGFVEGPEELTAQGMRQRYLLGKYQKRKYEQIIVQSTDVYRTLQSAYAQMMAFDEQIGEVKKYRQPPFRVRKPL